MLRLAAVGAVDDGKSTLIGRLLHDSDQLTDDQLDGIRSAGRAHGQAGLNLSFATDGLRAERELGITIDVAHRYAFTAHRKLVIADCPGHLEYTRNTASGASTSDLVMVVVDASQGLREQTRRHLALALVFGIRLVVVAVNKMDLVGWSKARYREIGSEVDEVARRIGEAKVVTVPVSALNGDYVVTRSGAAPWYSGPTISEVLDRVPGGGSTSGAPRLPVQRASADGGQVQGTLSGGALSVGDELVALPSGRLCTVEAITSLRGPVSTAASPLSVRVRLDPPIRIGRGEMLAGVGSRPRVLNRAGAVMCWLGPQPLTAGGAYVVKQATRLTEAKALQVACRLDLGSMRPNPATHLGTNEIGLARWQFRDPLVADPYSDNRATGSFLVIDPGTRVTVGAGMLGHTGLD